MTGFVSVGGDRRIAEIVMHRPPVNAWTIPFLEQLGEAARQVSDDPNVRAVILRGLGDCFSAGADIKTMAGMSARQMEELGRLFQTTMHAVEDIRQPVIAAIQGPALGGGLELALCADFRIAGNHVRMGLPEVKIGVLPGAGGTQRLPRLVGVAHAKSLIMLGRQIKAEEALRIGLVNRVVDVNALPGCVRDLAEVLAAGPSVALRGIKRAIRAAGTPIGYSVEEDAFAEACAHPDRAIGMQHFANKGEGPAVFTH